MISVKVLSKKAKQNTQREYQDSMAPNQPLTHTSRTWELTQNLNLTCKNI